MPAWRPNEYSEEYLVKAREYLEKSHDVQIDEDKIKVNIPTKGWMATFLWVARDTLYDWASKYEEFSDIMEELWARQEERLINCGLSWDYNPTIAKVLLTKHWYVDKSETEMNGKFNIWWILSEIQWQN
jgi:hypothetical protein